MSNTVFREVRYSLYLAIALNGIFIQWFAPFTYKCDITTETCYACGMRTAIDLLLQGKFSAAYHSNKLIVVVVLLFVIMTIDVSVFVWKQKLSTKFNGKRYMFKKK